MQRLYVDLDGSLITTDSLEEACLLAWKKQPATFLGNIWMLKSAGKAWFKHQIARIHTPNAKTLPYHEGVLAYLKQRKGEGTELVLATAAAEPIARAVAEHLQIFDGVLSTTETRNLSGKTKLEAIKAHANGQPFEYLGNDSIDRVIWNESERAHIVGTSSHQEAWIDMPHRGERFEPVSSGIKTYTKALRIHQWAKNLLVFVPLILAHHLLNGTSWLQSILAFFSLSLCASSVYVLNDLFDLESDREHPDKRKRPFASGKIRARDGLLLATVAFISSMLIASMSSSIWLVPAIIGYYFATSFYTWFGKRIAILDVVLLSLFYVFRLMIGSLVTSTPLSGWLLAFALFFFLGLAWLKRYGELVRLIDHNPETTNTGRGYQKEDLPTIHQLGISCSFLSLLIFALYLHSNEVASLYQQPWLIWAALVGMTYWMCRLWILAGRKKILGDPLQFALHDPTSYAVLVWIGLVLWLAS